MVHWYIWPSAVLLSWSSFGLHKNSLVSGSPKVIPTVLYSSQVFFVPCFPLPSLLLPSSQVALFHAPLPSEAFVPLQTFPNSKAALFLPARCPCVLTTTAWAMVIAITCRGFSCSSHLSWSQLTTRCYVLFSLLLLALFQQTCWVMHIYTQTLLTDLTKHKGLEKD